MRLYMAKLDTTVMTIPALMCKLLLVFGLVIWPIVVSAIQSEIVADPNASGDQRPTILAAPNGVPLVNIQTPSTEGVSRNAYSQFNVQQRGAILNNSRTAVQSQLGGWVQGNPWLETGSARVILNEVNSSNPSLLHGYIEVAGSSAQVIVANPSGITCDGCGFINAYRSTLTTGAPIFRGNHLDGYRVQGGTIAIAGNGLDVSKTDYTDLISRAVQINARISGGTQNQLKVTTGANQVNVDNTVVTPSIGKGTAPTFAIDVAQLGGMYAGKIHLVGTEAGVGVRNAGNIYAGVGDVIITADGRLENVGHINGDKQIQIDTQVGIQNSGLIRAGTSSKLSTRGNIANSGVITSSDDTKLIATGTNSIITSTNSSVLGAGIHADGSIGGSGTLNVSATQAVVAQGKNLSGGDQVFSAKTIDLSGSQTKATNLNLNASQADVNLSGATVNVEQTLIAKANQSLRTDRAKILAKQIKIRAHDLSNVGGEILQLGSGDTNTDLKITVSDIINSIDGNISASGSSTIKANSLDNTRGHITAGKAITAIIQRAITNVQGLFAAKQNIDITGSQIDNTNGTIGSVEGQTSVTATTGILNNTDGRIEAAKTVNLAAVGVNNIDGVINGSSIIADSHNQLFDNTRGKITTTGVHDGGIFDLQSGVLNNDAGLLQAHGAFIIDTHGQRLLNINSGQNSGIIGKSSINLNTGDLDNIAGYIGSVGTFTAESYAINNVLGGILTSESQLNINGSVFDNKGGQVQALLVKLNAQQINNKRGLISAVDDVTLTSSSSINNTEGLISAGKIATVQDANLVNKTLTINNAGGTLIAGQQLNVDSASLSGDGRVLSAGDLSAKLTQDHINTGEVKANGSTVFETTGVLTNKSVMQSGIALNLTAANLNNLGLIGSKVTSIHTAILNNFGPGRIYGDRVAIGATTLNNEAKDGVAPVIAAREQLDIGTTTLNNSEHALIFSAGDLAIGGTLDAEQHAIGKAAILNNNSATIEALGKVKIAAGQINNLNRHFSTKQTQVSSKHRVEGTDQAKRDSPAVYKYNYNRTIVETQVQSTDPAKILSGSTMQINADKLLNDKSHIIAGGTLTGAIGRLNNTEVAGTRTTTDVGMVTKYWIERRSHTVHKDNFHSHSESSHYRPAPVSETISLTPTIYRENTAHTPVGAKPPEVVTSDINHGLTGAGVAKVKLNESLTVTPITQVALDSYNASGSATVIRSGGLNLTAPDNSLFKVNFEPTIRPLVETDPRFANYREWLGSDYLLKAMAIDPTVSQKRLGDGFYEQRLIREQVAQLTGRRFLNGYANDEIQYKALMDNGVTFAKAHQLRPGIALSAEQMAQLTSDIVWLVEKDITLSNGQTTKALVPQIYVRVQDGDLQSSGALIAGDSVNLNIRDDLVNSGTIAGRNIVALTAENVQNLGGRISGNDVDVKARTDLNNIAGQIQAVNDLTATAGRDLNVTSTINTQSNVQGSRTNISRVAGLYVTGGGNLTATAGRNANFTAAAISNAMQPAIGQTAGSTTIVAGNNLNLGTVTESESNRVAWDRDNWLSESNRTDVGTTIQTKGDIHLQAGNDLNAKAASVTTEHGELLATAGHDINLIAGEAHSSVDAAHHYEDSGLLSSTTVTMRDTVNETIAQGSTLSGNTTILRAGHDISTTGSDIVGTQKTVLAAKNNVNIKAATNTIDESHFKHEKKSGMFSGGGLGFTIGTKENSVLNKNSASTAASSTVGSVSDNVEIKVGKDYTQIGSNVIAPKGNVAITAQRVDILEARELNKNVTETSFKQSGLTVGVTSPVVSAIQTVTQMGEAVSQTKDGRMQVLAGATTALAAKNGYDAITANPSQLGGINFNVGLGTSKSKSHAVQTGDNAAGSTVIAGGNVKITAIGAGQNSDLTIQGSNINAGNDAILHADNKVNLLAAKNTAEQHSTNTSSSSSVGVSVGTDGPMATASASKGRGKSDGKDVTYTNTHVNAANKLTVESGSDTNIKGAVIDGKQVVANVGGNLNIASLQDTSTYDSKQQSVGGSLSAGVGRISGSVNVSQSKTNSDFASVVEQSGIQAGDGGFQVNVTGNTDLKGAVISSSEQAVINHKNVLATATLTQSDIQNRAEYDAQSVSVGVGYSVGKDGGVGQDQKGKATAGGKQVPGSTLPSFKNFSATPPIALSASDSASSTTHSGISGAAITITDDKKQKELTGQDAAATIAAINPDVTTGKDTSGALKPIFDEQKKREIEAGFEIAGAFAREAGTFINNRAKEADSKKEQAEKAEQRANDPNSVTSDSERQALHKQAASLKVEAQTIAKDWGPSGTYRQIATALVAAASGNISAGTAEFTKNMVVNYVQQQGAEYIGKLVKDGTLEEGNATHTALHAIIGCAGAVASNQNCGSGAMGAAASSLLTNLFADAGQNETQAEKEAKRNIITSLVTGIAATGVVPNAATANTAATAATDNNWLATQQIVQAEKEFKEAKTPLEQVKVVGKYAGTSLKQDVLTANGIVTGLAESGIDDVKGIAEFLSDPIKGLQGLKQIITDPEARRQLGDGMVNELNVKIDRMSQALKEGGDQHAEQLGKDIGALVWQVGSVATVTVGVAKGGVALAKVGINVGAKGLETLAGLAKFDTLVAKGGMFASNGKPLMDFSKLTTAQKSIVGEMMGAEKIEQLIPGAKMVGQSPGIGHSGIDALFKANKPGVDYVIVEYKFGSSKLGKTLDGLQMSDDWLKGAKTGMDRILKSVGTDSEAMKIDAAMRANRVEKWLVHTDPFGKVSIGVLDKNGKLILHPEQVSKILGGTTK